MVEMELRMLAHKASLTAEQVAANEKASAQKDTRKMQMRHISREETDSLSKVPYLMRPQNGDAQANSVVNQYTGGAQRMVVQKDTID